METPTTKSSDETSGDGSSDSSPEESNEQTSPLTHMVETLAAEDEEENDDLAYAVGVSDKASLQSDENDERTKA
jgi:hypothetical protein